jgi:TfoX/Sxy family transcriptional regulator of competence genes
MASRQDTADYILDQLARAGRVAARKMFGEYGVYLDGKLVALIADDQFFVKPTTAGRAHIGTPREAPPYPGAKPYFLIDGDQCEDADWLVDLVRATARELPPAKAKAKAKAQKKAARKPTKKK